MAKKLEKRGPVLKTGPRFNRFFLLLTRLPSRTVTPYEYALNIARLIEINQKEHEFRGAKSTTPLLAQLAERLKSRQVTPVRT